MATDDADERGSSLESFDFSIKSALIGVHPWQKRENAEWPRIVRMDTDRASEFLIFSIKSVLIGVHPWQITA
jgi:hypothetical protein